MILGYMYIADPVVEVERALRAEAAAKLISNNKDKVLDIIQSISSMGDTQRCVLIAWRLVGNWGLVLKVSLISKQHLRSIITTKDMCLNRHMLGCNSKMVM